MELDLLNAIFAFYEMKINGNGNGAIKCYKMNYLVTSLNESIMLTSANQAGIKCD